MLVPLFFAILQLALIWHVKSTLTAAASQGAHYGAGYQHTPAQGAARTRAIIDDTFGTDFRDRVSAPGDPGGRAAGGRGRRHCAYPGAGDLGSDAVGVGQRARGQGGAAVRRPVARGFRRRWRSREPARASRDRRDGSALVEVVWLSLILLIPMVYILLTLVAVQRSAYGVTEAARAAGRAFVLSANPAAGTCSAPSRRPGWRCAIRESPCRLGI